MDILYGNVNEVGNVEHKSRKSYFFFLTSILNTGVRLTRERVSRCFGKASHNIEVSGTLYTALEKPPDSFICTPISY